MWRRVVCSGVVLLACNCSSKREEKKDTPSVAPAQQVPADPWESTRATIDSNETPVDATSVDALVENAQVNRYLTAYLDLLWADLAITEMLNAYPGVPKNNRYSSYSYEWKLPDRGELAIALSFAKRTAEGALSENGGTDRAVLAYTTEALLVWPELNSLIDYYKEQRFVDDEFARGRRDGPLVAEAIAKLAPLRGPMRESVFSGWREAAGDKTDSPRAIIGVAFEACMRVAVLIFARPKDGKQSAEAEQVVDDTMGACRRGVGAVSALPGVYRSFDQPLRSAAIAFGNAVDSNYSRQYAINDVGRLVRAYVEQWPKLPSEPAEKPAER